MELHVGIIHMHKNYEAQYLHYVDLKPIEVQSINKNFAFLLKADWYPPITYYESNTLWNGSKNKGPTTHGLQAYNYIMR